MSTPKQNSRVRALTEADAASYRALRLRALREEPEAFLITPEEEGLNTIEEFARRLRAEWSGPEGGLFGAFEAGALVGLCGYGREKRIKYRHKAFIWGMYVAPEARGRGLGRELLAAALDRLRSLPDVEQVNLQVTAVNAAAAELYRSMGFVRIGLEPRSMRVGDRYLDDETMALRLR
jgi:RimJ/RimL family protein N-acetyltransferase